MDGDRVDVRITPVPPGTRPVGDAGGRAAAARAVRGRPGPAGRSRVGPGGGRTAGGGNRCDPAPGAGGRAGGAVRDGGAAGGAAAGAGAGAVRLREWVAEAPVAVDTVGAGGAADRDRTNDRVPALETEARTPSEAAGISGEGALLAAI
ncbi:hypothetical protein Shyhy01_61670 [Streptomyces hygroscopicus subsp. hygroscopicus]|nr:hypothetical protein Shyhy01_61670 [Streptomyces hygroscopicus subsp. hygroscopicus]